MNPLFWQLLIQKFCDFNLFKSNPLDYVTNLRVNASISMANDWKCQNNSLCLGEQSALNKLPAIINWETKFAIQTNRFYVAMKRQTTLVWILVSGHAVQSYFEKIKSIPEGGLIFHERGVPPSTPLPTCDYIVQLSIKISTFVYWWCHFQASWFWESRQNCGLALTQSALGVPLLTG